MSVATVKSGPTAAEVRAWAKAKGKFAGTRGVVPKALYEQFSAKPNEVRAWAKATGRFSGTRGVLPRELVAEFRARPAGPYRTRSGKFVAKP